MRRLVVACAGAALFAAGCGQGDTKSAEGVVKAWGEAINAGDWSGACDLSAASPRGCEGDLRRDFDGWRLGFDGPAPNCCGEMKPGEESFSLSGKRGTVFVASVPHGDRFRVRVEQIVVQLDGASG